jgi:hypothetical protein
MQQLKLHALLLQLKRARAGGALGLVPCLGEKPAFRGLLASSQGLLTRGDAASSYVAYLLFAALVLVLAAFNFRHRKNVTLLACW